MAEADPFFAAPLDTLSNREALQLIRQLADRFSGFGYAFDDLVNGVEEVAEACAEQAGWPEFERAARYLEPVAGLSGDCAAMILRRHDRIAAARRAM